MKTDNKANSSSLEVAWRRLSSIWVLFNYQPEIVVPAAKVAVAALVSQAFYVHCLAAATRSKQK